MVTLEEDIRERYGVVTIVKKIWVRRFPPYGYVIYAHENSTEYQWLDTLASRVHPEQVYDRENWRIQFRQAESDKG